VDLDEVTRGSTSFVGAHSIIRQIGASASKFFTTGNLSHELKVGFGYRFVASDSFESLPGGQVWGDESTEFAHVTRAGVIASQTQRIGGFVSDTLAADRLTVNAGVRYDYARARNLASSVPANPEYPDILPAVQYAGDQGYPISAGAWQPRVGATYALGEKRRTLLRASYSRFANLFLDGIGLASPFPGTQEIVYDWTDTNGNHLVDPGEADLDNVVSFENVDPAHPASASAPNQIAPNLKPTTIDEVVVGLDQELFAGLTASAHYTYRSIRALAFTPYIGVTAGGGGYEYFGNASGSVTDPNGFAVSFDVPYFGLTIDSPGVVLRNRPGYGQTYQGVGLQLVKALSNRWMFRGTFSWNSWTQAVSPQGIFDPNDTPGSPNRNGGIVASDFTVNSAWVVSASGLYQLPFGFAVAGSFVGRQGFPQQYFVQVFPHDTLGEGAPMRVLTSPLGSYRLPNVYELDLRIENTFAVGPVSITPSLDVFNVANANTTLALRGRTGSYDATRAVPFRPDGFFNEIRDFESPRIFQVGIRVAF
jgi:hypothetical protein